jgi:hypothetical protein
MDWASKGECKWPGVSYQGGWLPWVWLESLQGLALPKEPKDRRLWMAKTEK